MTNATITTREYLQALSDKGYTVVPQTVKIEDVLSLYAQIDDLKAEVKNLDEGAKLMHSLATGGETSVLSRLDNGIDAVDAQRWQDEKPVTGINWQNYPDFEDEPKEAQPKIDFNSIPEIKF